MRRREPREAFREYRFCSHATSRQHFCELITVLLLDCICDVQLKHLVRLPLQFLASFLCESSVWQCTIALRFEIRLHFLHVDIGIWVHRTAVDVVAMEGLVQDEC